MGGIGRNDFKHLSPGKRRSDLGAFRLLVKYLGYFKLSKTHYTIEKYFVMFDNHE